MTDAFAELVLPIYRHVIDLKSSLSWAESAGLEEVKKKARDWVLGAESKAQGDPRLAAEFALARYGLVAWIDEVLTDSTWGQKVGWGSEEHFLEWDLYRTNLRAGRFYKEADVAYAAASRNRSSTDPVEAYLLGVALGFRGDLAHYEKELAEWVERFYAKVSEASPLASRPFPDDAIDGPAPGLAPRTGAALLLRVSVLCAITAVATTIGYMLAVHAWYQPVG